MDLCRLMYVRIFTVLFVLVPCGCEERVNLSAVVGSSVTFPDPVKEKGYFILGRKPVASVFNGVFEIDEDIYSNRLHWSSSGLFTLSDLKKTDSGVYSIDSKRGTVFNKLYELKVYDPVSAPVVSCLNVSEDTYSVLCSVNKTEQTSVLWFRGEQPVSSSRSGELLLTVQQRDPTLTYRCVSENPADTRTITVNIRIVCEKNETRSFENTSGTSPPTYIYFFIPIALVVLLLCFVIYIKYSKKDSRTLQTQALESFESIRKFCSP